MSEPEQFSIHKRYIKAVKIQLIGVKETPKYRDSSSSMIPRYGALLLIFALTGCAQPVRQVSDMNYPIYNMLSAPGHEAVFQVQPNTIELHIVSQQSWKATQPPDRLAYAEIKNGSCYITIPSGYIISYDSYRGKAQWADSKMDEILAHEILHCYIFDWHASG